MKRKHLLAGILVIISLLMSTTILIPQAQSKPVMDKVNAIEKSNILFEKIIQIKGLGITSGFFDWLKELILLLLDIIAQIQLIVGLVFGIINSIKGILSAIQLLITAIPELIQMISDFISLLLAGPQYT